jgi:hypothetical protein
MSHQLSAYSPQREKHGQDAHATLKMVPLYIWRECARNVRKTGFRLQTSDIRKRDKDRPTVELRKVKKKLKISIFIVIHMRAPCDVDENYRDFTTKITHSTGLGQAPTTKKNFRLKKDFFATNCMRKKDKQTHI